MGKSPAPSGASCAVTPNPVAVGDQYTIAGQGLDPTKYINVFVLGPKSTQVFSLGADPSGNFSLAAYASWAGTYKVSVDYLNIKTGHKTVAVACSFSVV